MRTKIISGDVITSRISLRADDSCSGLKKKKLRKIRKTKTDQEMKKNIFCQLRKIKLNRVIASIFLKQLASGHSGHTVKSNSRT